MRITWAPRPEPLVPCGAWAEGEVVARLLSRLLGVRDVDLERLEGVVAPGLIIVCGAGEDLPWVDGVQYLGRHPDAPRLLVPTREAPSVSPAVLDALIEARHAAVLPGRIVRLDKLRPIARTRLEALT
ncbi:MAG: hypothetical protein RMA76_42370 [Deltaproteobacteria bacterium]|jgi:hypothetical protein